MATKDEVHRFLSNLEAKSKIHPIIFRNDRGKNQQTLLDLEITPLQRETILKTLTIEDYSEGPVPDILNKGPEMWVFGKTVEKKEVYIKITLGMQNYPIICISFHIAEYTMNYPLKTEKI